jgi:hypothetical protein
MSIASDLRSYADKAQAQLNDVTGQANELYGKTKENVSGIAGKATNAANDVRVQVEKAVNFEALKTAVEPYFAQVKDYTSQVTDRAEGVFNGVKGDKRVAKLVETVEERVVKPVQSLINRGTKPAAKRTRVTSSAAANKPASRPAATKPASKPASKPAARKAPAKRTTKS